MRLAPIRTVLVIRLPKMEQRVLLLRKGRSTIVVANDFGKIAIRLDRRQYFGPDVGRPSNRPGKHRRSTRKESCCNNVDAFACGVLGKRHSQLHFGSLTYCVLDWKSVV